MERKTLFVVGTSMLMISFAFILLIGAQIEEIHYLTIRDIQTGEIINQIPITQSSPNWMTTTFVYLAVIFFWIGVFNHI